MTRFISLLAIVFVICLMVLNTNAELLDTDGKPCSCAATADLNYVCGSDGVTYDNKAVLRCQNICKRSNIQIIKDGPC